MIIGKQFDKSLTSVDEPIPDISVDPNAVIRTAEVISGLKSIASRYTSDLKKQARAYAEEKVASALDGDTDFYSQAKDSLDEIYGAKREKATSDYAERSKELSQQKGEIGNRRASAIWRVSDRYDVKEGKLTPVLSELLSDDARRAGIRQAAGALAVRDTDERIVNAINEALGK